jgi:hypothetical protein
MLYRFRDWQLKLHLTLGVICLIIIFIFDWRGINSAFAFVFSFLLVFVGQKLYEDDTTENWLKFSFGSTAKSVVGGALMFIGWILFLRQVLAIAIASLFLSAS